MKRFSSVLVTGGAGFIGSYLVDRLLAERADKPDRRAQTSKSFVCAVRLAVVSLQRSRYI